jgi:hypothetical protein
MVFLTLHSLATMRYLGQRATERATAEEPMLKTGEVVGVWVWGAVVWIILAFAFGDFWWFRPLYRQLF